MSGTVILFIVFGSVLGVFVLLAVLMGRRSGGTMEDRWSASVKEREPGRAAPQAQKRRLVRSTAQEGSLAVRLVRPMAAVWRLGRMNQSRLQEMLVHAGIREKGAVEIFLGAKFALALALPAAAVAFLLWRGSMSGGSINYRTVFMYSCMALIVGMMIPNMWLRGKAKKRIREIRLSLPDALDLMIVCVESGLGLDAALVRISREMADSAPEFCEELVLLNLEISAGKPREECLRNLALRSGSDDVEALTARINQAARFGTNLGHSLRIHSESLRQKRRQEAEERAAKTTVKLLFPLVFFIFPALFVVILGPAVVKVIHMFM